MPHDNGSAGYMAPPHVLGKVASIMMLHENNHMQVQACSNPVCEDSSLGVILFGLPKLAMANCLGALSDSIPTKPTANDLPSNFHRWLYSDRTVNFFLPLSLCLFHPL